MNVVRNDKNSLSQHDRDVLRRLAAWQRETAESEENHKKIEMWLAHDAGDLSAPVPVIYELWTLQDERQPVPADSLECQDPWARQLEHNLRTAQYETDVMKDDHVRSRYWNVGWKIKRGDLGVEIKRTKSQGADRNAFHLDGVLKTLDDDELKQLHFRELSVDRDATYRERERLAELFDGILDVRIRSKHGCGLGITNTLAGLLGMEGMMMLMYDNPDGLHKLMAFLRDDTLNFLDWLEAEQLLCLNNENDYIGSGLVGLTHDLPPDDFDPSHIRLKDLWLFTESQESVSIGPKLFAEFVYPYMEAFMKRFGKVYFGCCEPVDLYQDSLAALDNLARVSASPWADQAKLAAFCKDKGLVYSRKPTPNIISATRFDEEALGVDIRRSAEVCRDAGCRLEVIQRDVYTINNELERLPRWVEIVRKETQ